MYEIEGMMFGVLAASVGLLKEPLRGGEAFRDGFERSVSKC